MQASLCKIILAILLLGVANSFAYETYPTTAFLGTNFFHQSNAPTARNAIGATGFEDVTNIALATAQSVVATNVSSGGFTNGGGVVNGYLTNLTFSASGLIAIAQTAQSSILPATTNQFATTNYVNSATNGFISSIPVSATNKFAITNQPVSSIQKDGIVSAYQTNIPFNQITDQTNIVYFKNGTLFPGLNNTNFYWNQTLGSYTNALGYYLFYNASWNSFLVQSNSSTYGSGANFVLGDMGAQSQDIATVMGSGFWANFAQDTFDESLALSGSLTNAATNSIIVAKVPVKIDLTTNLQTPIYMVDVNGRTLAKFLYNTNGSSSGIAPYIYAETNSGLIIATNLYNENQGGAQAYIDNQASSSIDQSEPRFSGGVVTLFGYAGLYGSAREYYGKWATGWPRPPWQSGGTLSFPFKMTPIGGLILGYNDFSKHTMLELGSNGVVTIAPSWTDRPQFYLMPSPSSTNTLKSGQIWHSTNDVATSNRIVVVQNSVAFPIPQLNTTNATLSAQTSFTWKFVYPFSDTNYSVTLTGGGVTLGTNVVIGAKTTTNVAITFPSFTGILNAIAARQ